MTDARRTNLLIGVMLALMLAFAGWSSARMLDHRRAARDAAADLAQCRQIAQQVQSLRSRDAVAAAEGDTASQEQALAQRVSDAAERAGLSGGWLHGIDHKPARRVGDTPYLRKPAVLFARGLTLPQIVALLQELTHGSALTGQDVQLRTPPGEDAGNRWDADITLSYLIYSPSSAGR